MAKQRNKSESDNSWSQKNINISGIATLCGVGRVYCILCILLEGGLFFREDLKGEKIFLFGEM